MGQPPERERKEGRERRALPRLSETELAVLAALDDLTSELAYAPTYREILARLGWSPKSKGSLHQYLERLRRLGVIEGSGRSLRVLSSPRQNDRSEPPFRSGSSIDT
jgi:hypothetical protein